MLQFFFGGDFLDTEIWLYISLNKMSNILFNMKYLLNRKKSIAYIIVK